LGVTFLNGRAQFGTRCLRQLTANGSQLTGKHGMGIAPIKRKAGKNMKTNKLLGLLEEAFCETCVAKALTVPQDGRGWRNLAEVFDCGAVLDVGLGHIYVATSGGKTALCIVDRK